VPVLGDERHAGRPLERSARGRETPGEQSEQLVLPAPLDRRDPGELAGPQRERGVAHARHAARVHGADARGAHHHGRSARPSCIRASR
jgi:hypothetical protein